MIFSCACDDANSPWGLTLTLRALFRFLRLAPRGAAYACASDDANSKGAANNDALRAALPGRLGRAFPVREV